MNIDQTIRHIAGKRKSCIKKPGKYQMLYNTNSLPLGLARSFCQIPLTLAHGTLDILTMGQEKLTRSEVMELISCCNNSA